MDMNLLREQLEAAVGTLDPLADYACAYARRDSGTQVRCDGQGATANPVPPRAGFTLSAWKGGCVVEESNDACDADGVGAATARLRDRLAALPSGEALRPAAREAMRADFEHEQERDAEVVPVAEKTAFARELRQHLLDRGEQLVEAVSVAGDIHGDIVFVDADRSLRQRLHRIRRIALAVFSDGQRSQVQLHDGMERIGGWEQQALIADEWDEILRDGPRLLGAPRLPDPGKHRCVFSPEFAGIFAHEAFGHGTEQDLYRKRRSRGAGFLGKQVASELVGMSDDPSNGWAASYFFDDEGEIARPTRIIENGMLVAGINDAYSHSGLVREGRSIGKSANGRREAFDHKVYTRMTNTFFHGGEHELDELLAAVGDGYYLTHPSNGMEDPQGWGIQLEGAMAERIRDGKLTGEVFTPVVVTGSVPELLQSVHMVGKLVHEASLGMCGKGYKEWVKVTDGGPALALEAVIA